MNIVKVSDYEEMSILAAKNIIAAVQRNPKLNLGLATGSTPQGVYKELVRDHKINGTSYKDVQTFNLDEYIGISRYDKNSYHYYMCQQLFNHIDIPLEQTHIPNGMAVDLDSEAKRYEHFIQEQGGIRLQLLGIGHNGHIGFNEPGTPFDSRTHKVKLAESTRQANARFFPSLELVPTYAITMGIASILESHEILLLVSGKSKANALARLLNEGISEDFPASALQLHKRVTIFADEAALSKMNGS